MLARLAPASVPSTARFSSAAFVPYAALIARLAGGSEFPDAAALNAGLADRLDAALGARTVRFEEQPPTRRRRLASLADAYEARIDARGRIPTRRCLHDFANALVWAVFPRAKRALASRQHEALRADVPDFRGALPNARSAERDVLAMLDEGGVLRGHDGLVVFGHAILEHLASSDTDVRGYVVDVASVASYEALDLEIASRLAWRDFPARDAPRVVMGAGDETRSPNGETLS